MDGGGELRALGEMQAAFVVAYTTEPGCIGKIAESAIRAGYSAATADSQGRRLLTLPHVRAAIRMETLARISGQLVTQAVEVIAEIMNDPATPKGVRLDAAKTILDRAGIVARPDDTKRAKSISEMSADELTDTVNQARAAQAKVEAQLRDITPNNAQIEGEAVAVDAEEPSDTNDLPD